MISIAAIPTASEPSAAKNDSYRALLGRLSHMSVHKYSDPYIDIAWDAPENALNPDDPRLCIAQDHPLASTAWYRNLDAATRPRFGLEWCMQTLKYGIGFEAVLNRGLHEFCHGLPNRSPEFRYAMHEIIEEARHTLMFQELIDRSDCEPTAVTWLDARVDDQVAHWGRTFPELFFCSVLAGELFIDDDNRSTLRRPASAVHPLVRRIVQIHVTEEARHVCFAERFLQERLPALSAARREQIAWLAPVVLRHGAQMMLQPDKRLTRRFGISRQTLREAFGPGTEHHARVARTTEPMRKLFAQHGLLAARHAAWWRTCGVALPQ